jgi:Xaa-Pro dipeptidase
MNYANRRKEVLKNLTDLDLPQILITDPFSIFYLTGIKINPYERFFALYIRSDGSLILFLNKLFKIPETDIPKVWIDDTDNVISIIGNYLMQKEEIGIDKTLPARFLLPLLEKYPLMHACLASSCVDNLRAIKDSDEQKLLKAASALDDKCMAGVRSFIHDGITEKQCSEYLSKEFYSNGPDVDNFGAIVAFGKNASDPHHSTGNTILRNNDCILIDMGCTLNGYYCDMTRTFFWHTISDKGREIYSVVKLANEKAESIIHPGIPINEIDAVARNIITKYGYGEFFTHRLGHFIGLECHEEGDISSTNCNIVQEGMCFSIEPGIYLPGDVGVRIEDLVMVTQSGCEILNHDSKELQVL